jgi:predicted transcriptional regulator
MFSFPQELEALYLIPALRKELAKALIKKHKLNQSKAAELLGINKAAVSQYLHSKRASNIKFPKGFSKEIEKSAEKVFVDKECLVSEIMRLSKIVKEKGIMCQVCVKYNKGILTICKAKHICKD